MRDVIIHYAKLAGFKIGVNNSTKKTIILVEDDELDISDKISNMYNQLDKENRRDFHTELYSLSLRFNIIAYQDSPPKEIVEEIKKKAIQMMEYHKRELNRSGQ